MSVVRRPTASESAAPVAEASKNSQVATPHWFWWTVTYLGWQESLLQLAQLVEHSIPD
jgi:hypothetical protein